MSALSESGAQAGLIAVVGPLIWGWIDRHGDQTAFHKAGKVWGIPYSITIKWNDSRLHDAITQLIGPDPGVR